MPGVGVGGLFANLFNPGLDQSLAAGITPDPRPLAQQPPGGPGAPGQGVGGPQGSNAAQQPNLAPAAITAPDPVTAQYNAALTANADRLRASRLDALSADLNRNIEGVAAGFGTAQQQASKQAALGGGTVGDSLGALAKSQAIGDQNVTDSEHARFMANAATFAQTLSQALGRPVSVAEATEIMNNKDTLGAATGAMQANATLTGTQKDAEAATRAWANANPQATPQQIADYKANLIAGGMGGSDLGQRQYLAERSAALAAGQKDFPDYPTWQATHAAAAAAKTAQAKDAQEFKDSAAQDYTAVHSKLTDIQQYIDTLNKDPAAAQQALSTFLPTTGKWGALMPGSVVPQNVKDAAVALQKVQAALTSESLSNVKNVRNVREFNTLGQAATAGLNAAATPADFQTALTTLKNRYLDAQATAELTVGHKLTGNLVGHGNRDLLSPTLPSGAPNPYYNGGSEEQPATINGPEDIAKLPR